MTLGLSNLMYLFSVSIDKIDVNSSDKTANSDRLDSDSDISVFSPAKTYTIQDVKSTIQTTSYALIKRKRKY